MRRGLHPLLTSVRAWFATPGRERNRCYVPALEQLEGRNLLAATVIALDAAGTGFTTGGIGATENQFEFLATVNGRISILMHPEIERMHGELASGTPITVVDSETIFPTFGIPLASQLKSSQDALLQLDVVAGQTYQFYAAVPGLVGLTRYDYGGKVGPYRLYLSTETADFSATAPKMLELDSSGFGLQLGTLETPDDQDLFAFTATATGQAFVRVGGGDEQEFVIAVTRGQTYAVLVTGNGPYALTIHNFADDFPDDKVKNVKLNAQGFASRAGRINGGRVNSADDVDVFRFTAAKSGLMTLTLDDDWWRFTGDLSVSSDQPVAVTYDFTGPQNQFTEFPRVLQFQVEEGVQYTIQVSGTASGAQPRFFAGNPPEPGTFEDLSADYLLTFSMTEDDFADIPNQGHAIGLDAIIPEGVAGSQSGRIDTPGDQDRFKFTAAEDGYVIVALNAALGTELQGRLTTDAPAVDIALGPLSSTSTRTWIDADGKGVFTKVGNAALSRDHYVVIQVEAGQTYEFVVAADLGTIGDYTVALAAFSAATPQVNYSYSNSADDGLSFEIPAPGLSSPQVLLTIIIGLPGKPELPLGSSGGTNARLAVFSLPAAYPGAPTVTVPSGPATAAGNSLLTTLLTVAARDNAVSSSENVVAALGTNGLASSFLASLVVGVIAPGGGGGGGDAATPIGGAEFGDRSGKGVRVAGTVFEDLDGNGSRDAGEAGVAGETLVLESLRDGQYVVVETAVTDAQGAYTFANVPAGEYRVRRLAQPGSGAKLTTPASQPVKVTGDGKPTPLNFGKPARRGRTSLDHPEPALGGTAAQVTWHEEADIAPELEQVFKEWRDLDEPDASSSAWWLGVLPLATAVALMQGGATKPGPSLRSGRVPSGRA
ncbi:MAG: hypothetical protein JNM56_22960 [Planctomycetia bacterium]|nr:hypothetical protein [Planctomycetia bacterium]